MTFKNPVIKNEVDIIIFVPYQNSFLTGFKTKSISQFEDKFLKVVKKGGFQIRFFDNWLNPDVKKFKRINIFYNINRSLGYNVLIN